MRLTLLATVSILVTSFSVPTFAAMSDDAAYDKGSKPVSDSRGNCVRTKWQGDQDPCGTAPAPAPKVVAKPQVVAAPAAVPAIALEQRTVYFDFNKATLTAAATTKLDQLAAIINKSASIHDVVIHGFTDQIGTASYNDALATKRVDAVKSYLDAKTQKPVSGDVKGLGKSAPEAACVSVKKRDARISCMAKERRVEIEFKAQQ